MKDYAGNDLEVGMKVLICVPDYKHLVWATVEKVNPQTVTCRYQVTWTNDYTKTTARYPNQVVVPMPPNLMTTAKWMESTLGMDVLPS